MADSYIPSVFPWHPSYLTYQWFTHKYSPCFRGIPIALVVNETIPTFALQKLYE
jgi:hypothetical protein